MEIFFCDTCGKRVSESAIEGGQALHAGSDTYCADCLKTDPKAK